MSVVVQFKDFRELIFFTVLFSVLIITHCLLHISKPEKNKLQVQSVFTHNYHTVNDSRTP